MPKGDSRFARKRKPTSAEFQQLLEENDALRLELVSKDQTIAQLKAELRTKDQTVDQLELNDQARTKRMEELHDQISDLGVANRDLEAENRNLKFNKERLLEKLTEKQQFIIDRIAPTVRRMGDILGDALERAQIKNKQGA
jgi:septal ring factor EnvC (AmiA/AmiB activator)